MHHERLLPVSILGFIVNLIGIFVFQHGGHGHSHGSGRTSVIFSTVYFLRTLCSRTLLSFSDSPSITFLGLFSGNPEMYTGLVAVLMSIF